MENPGVAGLAAKKTKRDLDIRGMDTSAKGSIANASIRMVG
jgi:hypothetical protein